MGFSRKALGKFFTLPAEKKLDFVSFALFKALDSYYGTVIVYDGKQFLLFDKDNTENKWQNYDIIMSFPGGWKDKFTWNYKSVLLKDVPKDVDNIEEWADKEAKDAGFKSFDEMLSFYVAFSILSGKVMGYRLSDLLSQAR